MKGKIGALYCIWVDVNFFFHISEDIRKNGIFTHSCFQGHLFYLFLTVVYICGNSLFRDALVKIYTRMLFHCDFLPVFLFSLFHLMYFCQSVAYFNICSQLFFCNLS